MSSKKQLEGKLSFNQENIKEFIKKWNQGHTTFEITESLRKIELDIDKSKKKRLRFKIRLECLPTVSNFILYINYNFKFIFNLFFSIFIHANKI